MTTTPAVAPLSAEQLDNLEALAKAADPHGATHLVTHYRNSADVKAEEAWRQAAKPVAILALIAQARAAVPVGDPTTCNHWSEATKARFGFTCQQCADECRAALAQQAAVKPAPNCGSYACRAARHDGVICADGECDIASGVRAAPVAAAAPAEDAVLKAEFGQYVQWCAERKRVPMKFSTFKVAAAEMLGQRMPITRPRWHTLENSPS